MNCPICGHDNPADAKFCAQCGNRLETVCSVCSFRSPPDAKFCSNCGNSLKARPPLGQDVTQYVPPEMLTKITAARSTNKMRGERRTVTMLFADIQGSTAAAERLDPEDWTDIINGAFEHLIAPVYRYEGTLARLLGDAVLAFFGAPIAHEDDPVRAVRAGLEIIEAMEPYKAEILERWSIPIDVRVGLNTGLVVVGGVGSDLRVEYTALGDAVNMAARMEQTAEPGTVRVTQETWTLVADHFEGEEIGPVEVKGKAEPVVAVRVLRRREPQIGVPRERPLIGRAGEMATLDGLRKKVVGGGGWIASVVGEAGVGKSRLTDELRRRLIDAHTTDLGYREAPGDLAWLAAYSASYDSSIPYSTIRDLLARWWELDGAEDPYAVIEAVAKAITPDVSDAAAYLGFVAGVPLPPAASDFIGTLDPPILHGRVRNAVTAYLRGEATRRPLIAAFEDIHWADPMSLALIEDVMELAESAPLGLLFSMRPYRDEPPWRIHEIAHRDHPHRYTTIELVSLPPDATENLLEALLDGATVPDELRRRILDRSDGNPLFIEQMVAAIREGATGTEGVPVPSGLTSLLTARLDRLDPDSRMVAQLAAVIGTEFDRGTLAALAGGGADLDRRLTDLLRRGIIVEHEDDTRTLAFHHALMQEAAYSTMLLRTRRDLHGRLAEHLLATRPEAETEIALHFVEAGQMAAAFPHLVVAGEQATKAMALSDAIRLLTTALDNIPADTDPQLTVRAHDLLGQAYTLVPDLTRSQATYQRLADYADRTEHPSAKVKALNRLASASAIVGGDLVTARRYLDDAHELAEQVGDEMGLAEYHLNACMIAGLSGDIGTSLRHDEEIVRQGSVLDESEIRREGLTRLAANAVWMMDWERAEAVVQEAIEAATQDGDEHRLALTRAMAESRLRVKDGDIEGAVELLLANEGILGKYASFYVPLVAGQLSHLLFERGDFEGAITRLTAVRQAVIEANMTFFTAITSAGLARIYASLGMEERHREMRQSARQAVTLPLGDFLASTVWAELGYAGWAGGLLEEAADDFDQGLASASASQYWEKPRLLCGRALVHAAVGECTAGHRLVDEAQEYVRDKGVPVYDPHVAHARGRVLLCEGKAEEARSVLSKAVDLAAAGGWMLLFVVAARAGAEAARMAGDTTAAAELAAIASDEVAEIARSIDDPELRAAFEVAWEAPLSEPAG